MRAGSGQPYIFAVAFSPDGRWIISGGGPGEVKFWDVESGRLLKTLPEKIEGGIESVAFSQDGRWLAAGGDDYTVKVWRSGN
jgi:WD40 repeat protein